MKGLKTTTISILAVGLLAGSAAGVAAQDVDVPPSVSAGCDEPRAEPGVYDGINDFDDADQAYRVVVPASYPDFAPAPLILWLAAGSGFLEDAFEWWQPYLEPAESIFVTAELTNVDHLQTPTLVALIDQLLADYCIDPRRVHAMGQSSSGSRVATLACDAPDRIASFYAGMGSFPPLCASPRPVPLISVTGDPDRSSASNSVEKWADTNGCDSEPVEEDLGSGVTRKSYQGCDADTVLYDVDVLGHGFVRQECLDNGFDYCLENEVFDLLREAERFFAEHPLSSE